MQIKRLNALWIVIALSACTPKSAEEQLANAMALVAEGEKVAAIVELKNAVITEPNNAEARYQLGRLEFEQGLFEESEKEIRRALDLAYPVVDAYPVLIRSIFYQNDFDRVLLELDSQPVIQDTQVKSTLALFSYLSKLKGGEQDPVIPAESLKQEELLIAQAYQTLEQGNPTVALNITQKFTTPSIEPFEKQLLKGMIYSLQNEHVNAIIAFTDALEIFPSYHVARFLLAEQLIEDKQLTRADEQVERLLLLNPNSGHANYLKALIYFYQDNYEQALQLANVALQNDAKPALASFVAGTSAYRTGRLESALRYLNTAASTLPPGHPTHRLLAQVKLELGYVEDVASSLDGLSIEPGQGAEIYSLAALQKLQKGQRAESERYLSKARTLDPNNPVSLLREGFILLDDNQASAVDSLTQALNIDPNLGEAWILLAQAKYEEKGLAAALAVAEQWGELSAINGEFLKGILYLRDNQEVEAGKHFSQVLKYDPENTAALRYMMIGKARQDKFEDAMVYAEKLLALTPNDLQNLIDVVNIKIGQGQESQLESYLTQRIAAFPDASAPVSALAFIYLRSQQPDKAISLLKKVEDPQNFGIYQALGDAYVENGEFSQAVETYKDWTDKFPTDRRGWYRLISTYQFMSNFDGAMEATQQARTYFPQDKRLVLLEAHLAASTGKFAQSKRAISILEEDGSELAALTHTRGLLALNEKRYSDAVKLLTASYENNPGFAVARLLAFALAGAEDAKSGLNYLHTEVGKSPENTLYKFVTAEYATAYGFYSDAITLYDRILVEKPNDFAALNNLAGVHTQAGNYDKALEAAKAAFSIAPESEFALDTLGYILIKMGDVKQGRSYIEKALGKAANNKEIQLHAAEAMILDGDKARAKNMLGRIYPTSSAQKSLHKALMKKLEEQQ
ncbi:PEP-CTERM system TPR-repeat protein PrsT [Aestuariibacter sp. GS-14]|uniref:XrtA/PEP-CTERM system TPR-repeat protein PrsT n=1 Tax=Aestuariibacter sp. GS-14 TaxID=2590670 RepID=UPI00112CCDCD|nr:XrtA/PEP-CTERM system TPR-repeat protein PrsT [Aestuariibacter sp. GS-14]TPV62097.1 PEP-CTERM system TPR-repeat protein PrsT [Aestuariibacter sp. GS-14]